MGALIGLVLTVFFLIVAAFVLPVEVGVVFATITHFGKIIFEWIVNFWLVDKFYDYVAGPICDGLASLGPKRR